jgi:hypothetical protein
MVITSPLGNPAASFPSRGEQCHACFVQVASGPEWPLCRAWERNHLISLVHLGTKAAPLVLGSDATAGPFDFLHPAVVLLDPAYSWHVPISPFRCGQGE